MVVPPHVVSAGDVASQAFSVALGGYPLGRTTEDEPVSLGIFRARSTTVALLVGLDIAVVLAARAAGVGARVVVCDDDPGWQALVRMTSTLRCPVEVGDREAAESLVGSFERPIVLLTAGSAGEGSRRRHEPWVTRIVALPTLDLGGMALARAADVVLLGGVARSDEALVRSSLRLPSSLVRDLSGLRWSQVLVVAGGRYSLVDLTLSEPELRLHASTVGWARGRRGGPGRARRGAGRRPADRGVDDAAPGEGRSQT